MTASTGLDQKTGLALSDEAIVNDSGSTGRAVLSELPFAQYIATTPTANTLTKVDATGKVLSDTNLQSDASGNDLYVPGLFRFNGTPQTISNTTDAVNVTTSVTEIDTVTAGGAHAGTLADASAEGQIKIIILIADGGDSVITPTNFGNGTTITFNDAGDSVTMIFQNATWYILSNNGATIA